MMAKDTIQENVEYAFYATGRSTYRERPNFLCETRVEKADKKKE